MGIYCLSLVFLFVLLTLSLDFYNLLIVCLIKCGFYEGGLNMYTLKIKPRLYTRGFLPMRRIGLCFALCLIFLLTSCVREGEIDESNHSFPFKSAFLNANGATFHYLYSGKESASESNKPVMILLHGFPHIAQVWYPLLEHFADDYIVIAPDLRGYGKSEKSAELGEYRIANLVKDIRRIATQISPGAPVTLVGHDWGGVLAWGLAQSEPQLIEKLVVINAPQFNAFLHTLETSEAQRSASKYVDTLDSWWIKPLLHWFGPQLLWRGLEKNYSDGRVAEAYKQAFFSAWQNDDSVDAALNYYSQNIPKFSAIKNDDYWPSKPAKANVDALLIWSINDKTFTPETRMNTQRFASSLTTYLIDTDSHTPQVTHFGEVIEVMSDFIEK